MRVWRGALETVPRHSFLPPTVWVRNPEPGGPARVPLHRDEDPEAWLAVAYGDAAVTTQVDDGQQPAGERGGTVATSSASAPGIVAVMLAALDAQIGHRVLEIGTGTGYNAALLAHRLGSAAVTTVEIDPHVARAARQALCTQGFAAIQVENQDGEYGWLPGVPYDRVLATASVTDVPYAWVRQTRPGGRIVLPWRTTFTSGLLSLDVDGGAATGRIVDQAQFMPLRSQRSPERDLHYDEDQAPVEVTCLHPHWVMGDLGSRFAIGQRVPDCEPRWWPYDPATGRGVLWLLDRLSPEQSWAMQVHRTPDCSDEEFEVRQFGPRRLWDEVTDAYQWWRARQRPAVGDWRFTVTRDEQRIEVARREAQRAGHLRRAGVISGPAAPAAARPWSGIPPTPRRGPSRW